MKKLLLVSAIILPLAGCEAIWNFNLAGFILDDILGCEGNRTEWPCTVDYVRDDRHDMMQDPNDHDPQGRPSRSEPSDNDKNHEHEGDY